MKTYRLLKNMSSLMLSALLLCGNLAAQKPATPKNLTVDTVIGHQVSLTWENPDEGNVIFESGFENANPADSNNYTFEQGWTVKSTNTSHPACTWFNYPTDDFWEMEDYTLLIHNGKKSAVIFPDPEEGGHPMHQDEWLISPTVPGAAYLRFYHFIDPQVLIDGQNPNFPDHYTVIVSTDDGETWSEPIWDARYDASPEGGWQEVNLSLTAHPTEKMKVAFRAYGDIQVDEAEDTINQSLYAVWAIDDVKIIAGKDNSLPTINHYKITLDGKELAHVSGLSFVDNSKKNAGEHTYAVYSVTSDGSESEPAPVSVELDSLVFAAPRNFTCTPTLDENTGKYTVTMKWDAPDTKFQPVSYTIYNGNLIFGMDLTSESGKEGVGMSGCFGVYQFSIVAIYESPDGESEPVVRNLDLGVRFGVNDLKAEITGKDVSLSWKAPYESDFKVASYTIYRSEEKLAEGVKGLTYRDASVADGLYQYTVIAVYEDKKESVRTSVSQQVGGQVRITLPYSQNFNTTFCPANWKVVNQSNRTPDRYNWYFDDQSRLGVKGAGFDGCYAAIDCIDAKGYTRDATLELPAIDLSSVKDRGSITLSFYYSYATGGSCNAGTEWSVDGKEWGILEMMDKETGFKPGDDGDFHIQKASHNIGYYEAIKEIVDTAHTLYLRIHYSGTMSNFLAVDNVSVGADGVAIEKTDTDPVDIKVSSSNGLMNVHASHNIRQIEVYSLSGSRIADYKASGETSVTVPAPAKGIMIVRVRTDAGTTVVKTLL